MTKIGAVSTGLGIVCVVAAFGVIEARLSRRVDAPKYSIEKAWDLAVGGEQCHGEEYLGRINGQTYLCVEKEGPRIINDVPVKTVLEEMMKRENNAWEQLRIISELREDLSSQLNRAHESREEYGKSPRAADIRNVIIAKTGDLNPVWVIKLYTADGVASTLWLDGEGENKTLKVRSVSPY